MPMTHPHCSSSILAEYLCHAYVRGDRLAACLISDHEYPNRVAHTLITNVMDEFAAQIAPSTWATATDKYDMLIRDW